MLSFYISCLPGISISRFCYHDQLNLSAKSRKFSTGNRPMLSESFVFTKRIQASCVGLNTGPWTKKPLVDTYRRILNQDLSLKRYTHFMDAKPTSDVLERLHLYRVEALEALCAHLATIARDKASKKGDAYKATAKGNRNSIRAISSSIERKALYYDIKLVEKFITSHLTTLKRHL